MEFEEKLKEFSARLNNLKDSINTEEATKTSMIMPSFQLLGYDIFNPNEFIPEFTRWAGPYSIYGYDALKKSGSDVKDVNAYFIRHDSDITSDYLLRLNGKIYQIDHIQYDEDTTRSQYDVLYCHRWGNKKHG